MKKIITVMVCLAILGVLQVKAQLAQITLIHNDQATMFTANEASTALEAAEDGDVLYFTEGSYSVPSAGLTISKRVALVGAGQGTVINGNITIALGVSAAAMPEHTLDALNINGNVVLGNFAVDGLNIRKCKFNDLKKSSGTAYYTNLVIDRCFITGSIYLSNTWAQGLTVLDSKINELYGHAASASAATFVNCNIYSIKNTSQVNALLATLLNCVIGNTAGERYYEADCILTNCLSTNSFGAQYLFSNCTSTNCKQHTSLALAPETLELVVPQAGQLEQLGYLGTDGTPVGITGGTAPFTLVPSAPRITESVIKVDPETKTLNVNLKVTAN